MSKIDYEKMVEKKKIDAELEKAFLAYKKGMNSKKRALDNLCRWWEGAMISKETYAFIEALGIAAIANVEAVDRERKYRSLLKKHAEKRE